MLFFIDPNKINPDSRKKQTQTSKARRSVIYNTYTCEPWICYDYSLIKRQKEMKDVGSIQTKAKSVQKIHRGKILISLSSKDTIKKERVPRAAERLNGEIRLRRDWNKLVPNINIPRELTEFSRKCKTDMTPWMYNIVLNLLRNFFS